MKGLRIFLVCVMLPSVAWAGWNFTDARVVAEVKGSHEWLQLQSSGRKNIAATSNRLGVVYARYDRQKAEVYLATTRLNQEQGDFEVVTLNATDRPHDPLIRPSADRFIVGWLDDRGAWLRTEQGASLSEPLLVQAGKLGEFTFAADADRIYCFWTVRDGERWRLMTRTLTLSGGKPVFSDSVAVAPVEAQFTQRQPAAAVADGRIVVAWQDRSTGTSVLYAAVSNDGLAFGAPVAVNETIVKSADWGKGSSAIEGVFATSADKKLVLAWLDKRSSRAGYKVYASVNRSLERNEWKPNRKVQDELGDFTPQWNVALSDSATDRIVAAWSDSREENPDIWISDYQGGLWTEDELVDAAATGNSETDPSLVIDADDHLHIVWLVTEENKGQRILYARASR